MKVIVKDGNLTEALRQFKASVKKEGILKEYKDRQAFRPKRERRRSKP